MTAPQIAILAAGLGTRLGRPFPKPLTPLATGRTILGQQIENIRRAFGETARVVIVVGFKMDLVMEAFPDVLYAYNENYDQTNTSKSLLKALRLSEEGGVLWMNGDVVFDAAILEAVQPHVESEQTFVCVNTSSVGEEEIKYAVDADGFVRELSKTVEGALGEAVGINYVSSADKPVLLRHLERCGDQDYFERALEIAIGEDGLRVRPVDISRFFAVEVDFEADLARANAGRRPPADDGADQSRAAAALAREPHRRDRG
ncbi:MAG: phosphocholine cytidylyltransferase family protein [Actinomycetota bacterium]|nr:phosphocholine cytidylyltransferase family protein [Actinomycetota bacterium]